MVTAVAELMVTSGDWNAPSAGCGTLTPLTLVMVTVGAVVDVVIGGIEVHITEGVEVTGVRGC